MAAEHTEEHGHAPGAAHAHVAPVGLYVFTFFVLMILLIFTLLAARIDLGPLNIVLALTIAVIKAGFVIWNFMGVRYASKLTWIFAFGGFAWMLLMFLIFGDYVSRVPIQGWKP